MHGGSRPLVFSVDGLDERRLSLAACGAASDLATSPGVSKLVLNPDRTAGGMPAPKLFTKWRSKDGIVVIEVLRAFWDALVLVPAIRYLLAAPGCRVDVSDLVFCLALETADHGQLVLHLDLPTFCQVRPSPLRPRLPRSCANLSLTCQPPNTRRFPAQKPRRPHPPPRPPSHALGARRVPGQLSPECRASPLPHPPLLFSHFRPPCDHLPDPSHTRTGSRSRALLKTRAEGRRSWEARGEARGSRMMPRATSTSRRRTLERAHPPESARVAGHGPPDLEGVALAQGRSRCAMPAGEQEGRRGAAMGALADLARAGRVLMVHVEAHNIWRRAEGERKGQHFVGAGERPGRRRERTKDREPSARPVSGPPAAPVELVRHALPTASPTAAPASAAARLAVGMVVVVRVLLAPCAVPAAPLELGRLLVLVRRRLVR